MKEFFSKDYAQLILDSTPNNIELSMTFQMVFIDAIVHFTHFGKMADDTGMTTHAMFAAFVQCMAITSWSSQETVNILIPMLRHHDEKLSESAMTGLLIQVKRRNQKGTMEKHDIC